MIAALFSVFIVGRLAAHRPRDCKRPVGRTLALVGIAITLAGCGGGGTTTVAATPSPGDRPDYVGTGSKILGPVEFPRGADAHWASTEGFFFLIALEMPASVENPQLIVSDATSGDGYIPPGRYVLKVSTSAASDWALSFSER